MPEQCVNERQVTTDKDMVRCTNNATVSMEIQGNEFKLCLPCATSMIEKFPLETRKWYLLSEEERIVSHITPTKYTRKLS